MGELIVLLDDFMHKSDNYSPELILNTIAFKTESEIETMMSDSSKLESARAGKCSGTEVSRSHLGLRNDWLLELNIGNVMHLTPVNCHDPALSPPNLDIALAKECRTLMTQEMNKDSLIEKAVLSAISMFCISTEKRLMSDVSKH
jgi:hypothetical protein